MAANIAALIYNSSSFQTAWKRALIEYQETLPPEQENDVNIFDPAWLQLRSVDDLMANLGRKHDDFDKDTGRGTTHARAIQNSLSGVQTLINMFGGAAGAAFPPCSQILGAVSILMTAGKKVSGAFDEVSALFGRIGECMTQLKVLSQVTMEPELETCVTNILVCTLRICGIATRKAFHDETIEVVKEGHTMRRMWKKAKQKTMSTTSQYLKQLFLGDDPDITGAVSQLERGVEAEQRMIAALTKKDTTEIKVVSLYIGELSTEIHENTVGIQKDIRDMQGRVVELQGGVHDLGTGMGRVEAGVAGVQAGLNQMEIQIVSEVVDMKVELKAGQKKQDEDFKQSASKMDEILRAVKAGGQALARSSNSTASKAKDNLDRLRANLQPAEPANQNLFTKFKQERAKGSSDWILKEPVIDRWLGRDPKYPVLVISGNTGSGKTFLAARVIEKMQDAFSSGHQEASMSMAYFFCRKKPIELSNVAGVLRTLAFQVSEIDSSYTTYINTDNRMKIIKTPDTIGMLWNTLFVDFYSSHPSNSTMLVIDGIDECQNDTNESFEEFVQALQECTKESIWTLPNVRLLVLTSTAKVDNVKNVFGASAAYFTVEESRTTDDLNAYVKDKLRREWHDSNVPRKLREAVHDTVQQHCRGDFLRTSLILEEVTSLSREDDIWALLSRPPKTVDEATSLVLRRLCRRLDSHGLEDLVDILAWVACSHTTLSLATLDAILTIRNYEGSRLIDLKWLIEKTYTAMFNASKSTTLSVIRPEEEVRRRLGVMDAALVDSGSSPIGGSKIAAGDYEDDLLKQYHKEDSDDNPEQRLLEMTNIVVRLADNIADRLQVVTQALTTENLQCKTLLGCLKIICDPPDTVDKEAAERANEYCARNFSKHLLDVEVGEVGARKTREIVRLLLKVLRDESIIDRFIAVTEDNMLGEILLSPSVEKRLLEWLQSPDIQGRLPSADLQWISEAVESPTKSLFHGMTQGHARRWLTQNSANNINDNYNFIAAYRTKISKPDSSAKTHAIGDPSPNRSSVATVAEPGGGDIAKVGGSLTESSANEIIAVAEWAGLRKTPVWYRRVGVALYKADWYGEALTYYQRAMEEDNSDPQNHYNLGLAYWTWGFGQEANVKRSQAHEQAVSHLSRSVQLYQDRISKRVSEYPTSIEDDQALDESRHILAIVHQNTENVDAAEEIYRTMFIDWEKQDCKDNNDYIKSYAAITYLGMLVESSRHNEGAELLEKIVHHPQSRDPNYYHMHSAILYSGDTLLQLAYRTNRFGLLNEFWQHATFVVACCGEEGELAHVRWRHAHAIARLRPQWRDQAILMLKMVSEDSEAEHWTIESAEKELARIYLGLALESRDTDSWSDVDKYFRALNTLVKKNDTQEGQSFKNNESALFLASWYHMHRRFERARLVVKPLLERHLALLYDKDPDNDETAWYIIANVVLAIGDKDRAMAATNMKGSIAAYGSMINIVEFEDDAESGGNRQDGNESGPGQEKMPHQVEPELLLNASNGVNEASIDNLNEAPASTASANPSIDGITMQGSRDQEESEAPSRKSPIDGRNSDGDKADIEASSATMSHEESEPSILKVASGIQTVGEPLNEENLENKRPLDVEGNKADDSKQAQKTRGYTCDGPCFNDELSPDNVLYRCTICFRDFCEACWIKVKHGEKTGFSICNEMHDWVAMPPVVRSPNNTIRANGRDVPILDWLDDLADAFGIARRPR